MATAPTKSTSEEWQIPDYVDNVVLAGAAKTVTPPSWAKFCRIKATGGNVWINRSGTAIEPAADTGSGGGAPALGLGSWPITEDEEAIFYTVGTTTFSIIGTAIAAVAYYRDAGSV